MNRREFAALAGSAVLPPASASRFRKGIWCTAFARSTPYLECFRQLRNAGFEGMDLRLGQHVTLSSTDDEVKRMAEEAHKLGVTIVSMHVAEGLGDNPLNHPSAEVRARGVAAIERAIDITAILNHCPLLVVPGRLGTGPKFQVGYQDTWDRSTAEVRKVLPKAAAKKVIIGPENLWSKFLLSPLEMRAYVDQFKSPWYKVHFDVGNPMQYGYPQDWILTLGERIVRVHLKDYKLSTRAEQGRFVDLLEGDVDWKEVMAALKKVGYSGFLSPEAGPNPRDPDHLLKISRAVDKIIEMA